MAEVETAVAAALLRAQYAVEQDLEGNPNMAAEFYLAASNLLHDAASSASVPAEEKSAIRDVAKRYDTRLGKMELERPQAKEITFSERAIVTINAPLPPPNEMMRRSYWLMRVWAKTMVSGGYVTPQLYIPRRMWYQTEVKLSAIPQKIDCCSQVLDQLLKLPQEDRTNHPQFVLTLGNLCKQLDEIQRSLDKHLHCVVGIKEDKAAVQEIRTKKQRFASKMKRLGSTISKGATRLTNKASVEDNTAYVELLLEVFQRAQFLDEWLDLYAADAEVASLLDRISRFFYEVVCTFVLEDFNVLLERYMRLNRKTFLP
ncbi:microtubule interacting and transport domain-containing protein [Thecamonas trahens ATCC 50062]|uniref:Microtubule interacting and transport domain-containing protein n=1 Tax=Thecamonas trahens ATCC 50062 TaxID=461836 RepID=A0A0L0DBB3_THETB|nr:microtubule interacting and transport domain-containing protein [Thecamonas trahens ATCC 50062]KNC49540.1 microtubule interacting and transport domain-containing protein [Thecamonas trahens ATCC 50062]|eukprot:XP_013757652.1 microtubule interacting and transport domain-containing protein [Thecamonas trahens ATCC 50062]